MRFLSILLFALAVCGALAGASARADSRRFAYAAPGGETSIPFGWIDFCQRYKGECANEVRPAADINLTDASLREIRQVNISVNHAIEPVSDMDHWGVVDRWDLPMDGKGDCEDYALLKRKMLIERGYPRQALLITVVRDENNEGHAILTVKTNGGEYILDNLTDEMRSVDHIPYRLVKRQSQENPNVWIALAPSAAAVVASR